MTAPQTPRRSNRQHKLPARYGGGILISASQTYKWPPYQLHARPTQPTDLLPDEEFEPGETQFYSHLTRYGPPSKPIVRTYGKQRAAKPGASGSRTSEVFSVGDTVLVVSTAKTTNVAVITALWRVVRVDDEAGDDDEDSSESMRIRVHWFTRPAQLGSSRQKRESLPNEIYYSVANTAILSPQEIIRKCYITSRVPGSRPPTSPWPLTSRGETEGEGIPEVDRFVCRSAVNPHRGLFYEFTWEAHREHAKAAPPGDWSRWELGVIHAVPETPKPKTDSSASSSIIGEGPRALNRGFSLGVGGSTIWGCITRLSGLGLPALRMSVADVLRISFAPIQSSPVDCQRLTRL